MIIAVAVCSLSKLIDRLRKGSLNYAVIGGLVMLCAGEKGKELSVRDGRQSHQCSAVAGGDEGMVVMAVVNCRISFVTQIKSSPRP